MENKFFGLFIGINTYFDPLDFKDRRKELSSPSYDATSLSTAFGHFFRNLKNHIEIVTEQNLDYRPTKNELWAKIYKISKSINRNDLFVLYFAGHGATLENQLHLYPSDFDGRVPIESSINLNSIINIVSQNVKKKIFICDCCRSFIDNDTSVESSKFKFQSPLFFIDEDTYIINACSNGQYSYEMYGIEKETLCRGVFSYFLEKALKSINKEDVTLYDIFSYTREKTSEWVANVLSKHQVPILHGGNSSDWYIFPEPENKKII